MYIIWYRNIVLTGVMTCILTNVAKVFFKRGTPNTRFPYYMCWQWELCALRAYCTVMTYMGLKFAKHILTTVKLFLVGWAYLYISQ